MKPDTNTILARLARSARESARLRGHDMAPFRFTKPDQHTAGRSGSCRCRRCGAEMQVKTHPAPNEIDIGGEAVALNCKE